MSVKIQKNIMCAKKVNLESCYMQLQNGKYLESITDDDSVITCDEIINAADKVSTNVTSTVPKHFYNKNLRYKMDCYILHTVLLVIILLFVIDIICYHYAKQRSKHKVALPF